jgi:hypothetical protein
VQRRAWRLRGVGVDSEGLERDGRAGSAGEFTGGTRRGSGRAGDVVEDSRAGVAIDYLHVSISLRAMLERRGERLHCAGRCLWVRALDGEHAARERKILLSMWMLLCASRHDLGLRMDVCSRAQQGTAHDDGDGTSLGLDVLLPPSNSCSVLNPPALLFLGLTVTTLVCLLLCIPPTSARRFCQA